MDSNASQLESPADAVRVQVAAVAAQQIALDEEEARLLQTQKQLEARLLNLRLQHDQFVEEEKNTRAQLLAREKLLHRLDHLDAGWKDFKAAQQKWRERRRVERGVMKARYRELREAQETLIQAREIVRGEQADWHERRQLLEAELKGLENRVRNQREKLESPAPKATPSIVEAIGEPAAVSHLAPKGKKKKGPELAAMPTNWSDVERYLELTALQRRQLLDYWKVLEQHYGDIDRRQRSIADDLEAEASRLRDEAQKLAVRDRKLAEAESHAQCQSEELDRERQHLMAWQARIRLRDQDNRQDLARRLQAVEQREKLVEDQLASLADLRERWTQRRAQELELSKKDRVLWQQIRQEAVALRDSLASQSGLSAADREAFKREWTLLEDRFQELCQRAAEVFAKETEVLERQTNFEQQQVFTLAQLARREQAVENAAGQKALLEKQMAKLREELDRLVGHLMEEPPATLPLAA